MPHYLGLASLHLHEAINVSCLNKHCKEKARSHTSRQAACRLEGRRRASRKSSFSFGLPSRLAYLFALQCAFNLQHLFEQGGSSFSVVSSMGGGGGTWKEHIPCRYYQAEGKGTSNFPAFKAGIPLCPTWRYCQSLNLGPSSGKAACLQSFTGPH